MTELSRCVHCGCMIDPRLGDKSPGETSGRSGTKADPRAPGDWDDICDECNYGKGLQGGPNRKA